ncbi:MAG TPA: outer membrane beta-barrel protein [Opitutaceae bacterium]|nr:outer membrane beta-barrel protein [Opitutaceae bacterium]
MMNRVSQLGGLTATALALAATASADIKLNDNFSISGYAAGAYEYSKVKGQESTDSLFNGSKDTPSADAIKTALTANFKPVTGVISFYYIPNYPSNKPTDQLTVLDAYVTYDAGNGVTVTGGKFLSWMGYEAFDTANMAQITYGAPTVGYLAAIPAYHTGLKVEYGDKVWSSGVAVVDSVYSPYGYDRGDGELKHNAGFEAYLAYKGIENLTLWGGVVYDTEGGFEPHSVWMVDLWAQYALTKQITIAAELTDKNGGDTFKGVDWLAFFSYAFDDKFSLIARVSGEVLDDETKRPLPSGEQVASNYVQYTIGPSYKVTDNLTVRAEYSFYDYKDFEDKNFAGVQAVFKF